MKIQLRYIMLCTLFCIIQQCKTTPTNTYTQNTFAGALNHAVSIDVESYKKALEQQHPTPEKLQQLITLISGKENLIKRKLTQLDVFNGQLAMVELAKLQQIKVVLFSLLASVSSLERE